MIQYTASQFRAWRLAFGIYQLSYFCLTLPYVREIYSREGMLLSSESWTYGLFPNILNWNDSTSFIRIVIVFGIFASFCLAVGYRRRTSGLLLWYIQACLFNRNNLTENPSLPFIGWLNLVCFFIPNGEGTIFEKKPDGKWLLPPPIYWSAWIVLSASYLYSGISKYLSPSWHSGAALGLLFQSPISFAWTDSILEHVQSRWLAIMTWLTIFFQMTFSIFCVWGTWGRLIAWATLVAIHLIVLVTLDLQQVTLGILLVHLFIFDPRWLRLLQKTPTIDQNISESSRT